MKQTFAPKRCFDPNIEFDKASFIKQHKINSKIIDIVLDSIEKSIINAPNEYKNSTDKTLDMFSDLLYDTTGFLRLRKFVQYGSFYIAEIYDHISEHFFYLAYSIYDILDRFNSDSDEKVSYIKLYEADKDYDINVSAVKSPKSYYNEQTAIDENNKYVITINDEYMILYVSKGLICVSQVYIDVDNTGITEKITGEVTFKIGTFEVNKVFCFEPTEINNTEYQNMYNEIPESDISQYAPYGIKKWYCENIVGNETSDLSGVLTRSGPIKFEAVLNDAPEVEGN